MLHHLVPPRALPDDAVASPALVRVLSVAHRARPLQDEIDGGGQQLGFRLGGGAGGAGAGGGAGRTVGAIEPIENGGVVLGDMRKGLAGELLAGVEGERADVSQFGQDGRVPTWVDHHPHRTEVLGRGPHHGRTPDVDHLDRGLGPERVQIADHQIDRFDAPLLEVSYVVLVAAFCQDAAGDRRVQGLDPAVQHLRSAGDIGHLAVGDAGGGERRRGLAARHQLPSELAEASGQMLESALVVDGQQRSHSATSCRDPRPFGCRAASPVRKSRMVSG